MKYLKFLVLLIFSLQLMSVSAQKSSWKDSLDINVYGYVKLDAFYDTRETVNGREGHFLLWPAAPDYDPDGVDRAAHGSFNMLAVQSNFGIRVSGPRVLKAKTSAKIEGDFFGQMNDNINLVRLRHAYFQMQWKSTDLIVGQFWSPVFNLGAFPNTISFTTGTPVLPFSRNPQIRVIQYLGSFALIGVIQSQRDYPSFGPNPANPMSSIPSSEFLKNSGLPEFHGKITYDYSTDDMFFKAGIGGGYKQIVPFTESPTGYATNEKVPGISATAYVNFGLAGWNLKGGIVYGRNATDVMSLGGFAVSRITDSLRAYYEYTCLSSYSVWMDMSQKIGDWNIGVFAGNVENLGAESAIVGNIWGIGNDIGRMYRVAPRVSWQNKNFRLAFELEHTAASFGSPDENGIPQNLETVANTRFLIGAYYFFN
ncbi:MAG: DcaP family trimeric outer membrane transporter [Bacteroidales bacterium]|jgi:hypothetical protein|nr:DcaP family trimeric outer membrane transporter [Bacteroidales bacterium]